MKFLQELIEVRGTSGDESGIKDFILDYVNKHSKNWKVQPKIVEGKGFQDAFILVFGAPTTAIFAHTDTIGYTVGYENELIKIGGPRVIDGMELVGSDSLGEIETELMVIDNEDGSQAIKCVFDRNIDRGTPLSFRPNFIENDTFIQSPYLDNRLGCWNALKVAETLENGAIVFSTYEEHSGGSVGFLGTYLWKEYGVCQALISDITWVTSGVKHNGGVAISMRDKGIPRRSYVQNIIKIAQNNKIKYQLEVGKLWGDVPYPFLFIHEGNETWGYSNSAFNAMNIGEFMSDEYASLSVAHYFGGIFLNRIPLLRKLKWRELVTGKIVYGQLDDRHAQILDLPTYTTSLRSKPYAEASIGIENIFKVLRIDALWRLTYLDNTSEGVDVLKFGIRGKIQFEF